jgi:EAL domain-containing protein (putative c-di-GMP-specific phosphodiesterase class I)
MSSKPALSIAKPSPSGIDLQDAFYRQQLMAKAIEDAIAGARHQGGSFEGLAAYCRPALGADGGIRRGTRTLLQGTARRLTALISRIPGGSVGGALRGQATSPGPKPGLFSCLWVLRYGYRPGRKIFGSVFNLTRGSAVLDTVKQAGDQMNIRMLPVLKKPFETSAIQKTMSELKIGHRPVSSGVKVELAEALKNNWVEFWYQPKIDLRRKQLAGAEAFARVCHPKYGVLTPQNFMPGADEASVLTLAERALVSALQSGLNLSRFGVNLRIAINVPVKCLVKLPVGKIVREHRPQVDDWPGMMIDVTEDQILSEITLAHELSRTFAEHNVRLAIDDFGKGCATLMKLKELPFAGNEARSLVRGRLRHRQGPCANL